MPTIIVDLPWPPSTNRLWRNVGNRVYRDRRYTSWRKQAGLCWMSQKKNQPAAIEGKFRTKIILNPPDSKPRDIDNFHKAIIDLAQSLGLVGNDNLNQKLDVVWGCNTDAPLGARLILESC